MTRLAAWAVVAVLGMSAQACASPDDGHAVTAPSPAPSSPTEVSPEPPSPAPDSPTRFRVASFNVLGASHTTSTQSHYGRSTGKVRARWTVQVLNRHRVDVVGLQELEPVQFRVIKGLSGRAWQMYPGMRHGARSLANSVAWRTDSWQLVRAERFSIPYFGGRTRTAPAVLLRHRETGVLVGFVNVHNPATTPRWGDNRRWRAAALRIEADVATRFRREGFPLVVTGDFNGVLKPFCVLSRVGGLSAANGGESGHRCVPSKRSGVDWIFGSQQVRFLDYVQDRTALVRRTSDHPIVVATAVVGAGL